MAIILASASFAILRVKPSLICTELNFDWFSVKNAGFVTERNNLQSDNQQIVYFVHDRDVESQSGRSNRVVDCSCLRKECDVSNSSQVISFWCVINSFYRRQKVAPVFCTRRKEQINSTWHSVFFLQPSALWKHVKHGVSAYYIIIIACGNYSNMMQ